MRALLLANPSATRTSVAVRDRVADLLAAEVDLTLALTERRAHATDLVAEAVADGVEWVLALGGDGTANEAMQPLAGTDVAFTPLPGGGANVLARALGLPNDPRAAARHVLARRADPVRRIGIGAANGRWFTFIAGFGFDAAIVRRVEQAPRMKRSIRQLAFVWCGLAEWFAGNPGPDPDITVELPDGTVLADKALALIGNTDPYTYLGRRPLRITPQASFETGLDLLAVDRLSTGGILRTLGKAFTNASHVDQPHVSHCHDLASFTLRSDRPLPLMVDGDHTGEVTHVELRAVPGHLAVRA